MMDTISSLLNLDLDLDLGFSSSTSPSNTNAEIIYSQVNKQEYALNIQEDEFMQKSDFFKYFILVFLIL